MVVGEGGEGHRLEDAAIPLSLDRLALREAAVVLGLASPADAPEWADGLAQIGFLPGEAISVVARGMPGGDPLAVRVGDSTFALRRAEAACVRVRRVADEAAAGTDIVDAGDVDARALGQGAS